MLQTTIKPPSRSKKGISTVIVVMLSLVLLVIVVANVVLWSYQMNEFDYEKMHEDIRIASVNRVNPSSWSTAQSEFSTESGTRTGGTYIDTYAPDDEYESFQESLSLVGNLDIIGDFLVNMSAIEPPTAHGLEMQMRYRASDDGDKMFLQAYDWNESSFGSTGLNSTKGSTSSLSWTVYTLNVTSGWRDYVRVDGLVRIRLFNDAVDSRRTTVDIDFIGVRPVIYATEFRIYNEGSFTSHLVGFWMDNSTLHVRKEINLFVGEGERFSYVGKEVEFPVGHCVFKIVTERGNIAVFGLN
jgi:hypothetical protein